MARADYADFEDFWSPFTLGVGPIGLHYESLDDTQRKAVRSECRRLLNPPEGAFTLQAACWFAAGRVPNHGEVGVAGSVNELGVAEGPNGQGSDSAVVISGVSGDRR